MPRDAIQAALERLTAPWWEVWLVRLFGKHATVTEGEWTVKAARLWGKVYMLECYRSSEQRSRR